MKLKTTVAVGIALAVIGGMALAQKSEVAGPAQLLGAASHSRGEFFRCEGRNAIVGGVLTLARARLNITSNQEPAWTRFTEALYRAAAAMDTLCTDAASNDTPPTTLSGLIERRLRTDEVVLQVKKEGVAALKELEASLTQEQKQRLLEMIEFVTSARR